MPEALRIASIDDGGSGWFFGVKASIDGGMTLTRARSKPSQTNAARENTIRSASLTCGSRNDQAARTSSFGASAPTWQRQTTPAP